MNVLYTRLYQVVIWFSSMDARRVMRLSSLAASSRRARNSLRQTKFVSKSEQERARWLDILMDVGERIGLPEIPMRSGRSGKHTCVNLMLSLHLYP